MKILIYVGYQSKPYNGSTVSELGLGGTEQACANLAKQLAKLGHDVQVSGQVLDEVHEGVEWNASISDQHFDVVIASSYIHYLLELEERRITFTRSYFWVHNEDYFVWWKGEAIENHQDLLNRDKLTGIICLTEWHKQDFQTRFKVTKPIHVIGNGIDPSTFTKRTKDKNSFIYSSAHERGLSRVLEMWPKIRSFWPNAKLKVFSPSYASEKRIKMEGVYYYGSVDQLTLHRHMAESQFWLYPTEYKETYCITALEMQMSGVIPICSDLAALKETVGSRGFTVNHETNHLQAYINIVANLRHMPEMVSNYSERARNWAKCQTWRMRAAEWNNLIMS